MNIISPITITSAMMTSSLAEDTTAAWVSGTTYAVGDYCHVVATHRVYKCAVAGVSSTSPELAPTVWVDTRPTNKWAPFDIYTNTAASTVTSLTYVLTPGYFNAIALYGLTGSQYSLTVKDTAGGTVIYTRSGYLYEAPLGWYEYLFGAVKPVDKLIFTDIPIRPDAEMTLTITAATGAAVGVGMIVMGDYVSLAGTGEWGGVQYGASAEPVTYSYIKTNDDGTTSIVKRHAATNLRLTIAMPRAEADAVLQSVQRVLDVPVAWIATNAQGYAGLTTFGLGSGSMSYDSFGIANLSITVKGLV
ncbi:hypothetical protein [Rhodoferax sp.]|uniref:hypothetical protein n=1 Tax=Rhodoferax sp. TaxID=50421 RepID=UPI00260D9510|nr:hypothetical protein [Rhodoferax sp.]MDD5479644.1 hypothetical protein [Rhodoferax sp.]